MWKGGGVSAPPQQPDDDALHDQLAQLEALLKSSRKNYKQILKIAEQVLAVHPDDPDALNCKVVALINSDSFGDALAAIDSAGSVVDLKFEKAYCLYRLGRFAEVLQILQGVENSPGVLQLKAQTLFKTGDLNACVETYETIHREFSIESSEVKSNAIAAYVSGGRSREAFERMRSMQVNPKTLFELAYNVACVLIDQGELSQAEEHLLLARRLGQEMLLEDEYSEDEIEDELAPVTAQLAYVLQLQGRATEATESCLAILNRDLKEKDLPTLAVVSNNLAAIRKNKDASDSLRKLEVVLKKDADGKRLQFPEALGQKMSINQKEALVYNYFLLLLSTNKLNQARELIPSLVEEYSGSSMPVVLKACLSLKEGKIDLAEEVLGEYAEKNSESTVEPLLLCAQARTTAGHYLEAADVLRKATDIRHMPAIVATAVDLKERGGDVQGAQTILLESVKWWEDSMEETRDEIVELLLHEAAKLKLKTKDFAGAAELYERLAKSSSSKAVGLEAITGLVSCFAETDVAKGETFEKQLPDVKVVDASKLEESSVVPGGSKTIQANVEEKPAEEKKRKRKRKPRYPKGYDPENPGPPPDPERWMPMRERSYYRPKKKDKRTAQLRGSQGAISRDTSSSSAVAAGAAGAAAGSNGPSTSKPAETRGGGKNKKKGRR
ncbi:signal recognition particle subunit SRP72 [Selaginella moellendorffii]|uniref:signal recognition particle subunit SRP72 n=1 Tax=Selaginella moellendorffii TaxID=88036 RepID=UPI000D1C54F6|nr:signal recognition particle subunit SRP72 [Selaginella moellendorffii]|eukprot:XP_024524468.1 signal recognition particle subunit SRP72 [Selaginella moellendorffii]